MASIKTFADVQSVLNVNSDVFGEIQTFIRYELQQTGLTRMYGKQGDAWHKTFYSKLRAQFSSVFDDIQGSTGDKAKQQAIKTLTSIIQRKIRRRKDNKSVPDRDDLQPSQNTDDESSSLAAVPSMQTTKHQPKVLHQPVTRRPPDSPLLQGIAVYLLTDSQYSQPISLCLIRDILQSTTPSERSAENENENMSWELILERVSYDQWQLLVDNDLQCRMIGKIQDFDIFAQDDNGWYCMLNQPRWFVYAIVYQIQQNRRLPDTEGTTIKLRIQRKDGKHR
jgi:hypothetical protein